MLRAAADRSGSWMPRGFRFETDAAGTMSATSRFLPQFAIYSIGAMTDQISLLKAQAQVARSHFRLCFQWLSITMKTKARLFYFASSLLPKWGLEWGPQPMRRLIAL